jgi:hypothetical protein
MMRTPWSRIARRCTGCLMLAAVAAWSYTALVDSQQDNPAQQAANDRYESLQQNHYSQLPAGHVSELFARVH